MIRLDASHHSQRLNTIVGQFSLNALLIYDHPLYIFFLQELLEFTIRDVL